MKDIMKACQHSLTDDVVYKEVVVIGNGPSGLVTSFMLAGNVPYLKEIPEDLPLDEMLRARLSNIPAGKSLYDVDLSELAEGLEGRSQNPISILMDALLRPCADMGIQAEPLIEWKYEPEKEIDHIVLGRDGVGGAWAKLAGPPGAWRGGEVRTLSPGAWLTLPPHRASTADRLSARSVAKYFRRYVHACKLQRFIRCNVCVTGVTRLSPGVACSSNCPRAGTYLVQGYDRTTGRTIRYSCARVVVASGADRPNTLSPHLSPHAVHHLAEVERAVRAIASSADGDHQEPHVLVVGSGVGAADAVSLSLRAGLRVSHAHRAPAPALAHLSPTDYPDYCQIYKMMTDSSINHPNYQSYPHHMIIEVIPETTKSSDGDEVNIAPKRVKLLNLVTNEIIDIKVRLISVLIGSKPDLSFLRTNFSLDCIETDFSCVEEKKASKRKIEDEDKQCFLRNHWHYLKTILGQSIQICKNRYLATEINGNDTKCIIPDCNRRNSEMKIACNNLVSKLENDTVISAVEKDCNEVYVENPYSSGLGFGIDPKKPVDSRSNPVAIDKSTHELLHGPKNIYALGPLTADNFIRFIPGGALAIVSHIHNSPA